MIVLWEACVTEHDSLAWNRVEPNTRPTLRGQDLGREACIGTAVYEMLA